MVGSWKLADFETAKLPEKVASAFAEAASNIEGTMYIPVLYCGEQPVNGTNYMIICKQTLVTNPPSRSLVTMVINCSEQGSSIVDINKIL